jgi:SSS family solute:Na+ symporter
MPALLASFYLCMICIAIQVVVSLYNPHKHTADSESLVWGNPMDCLKDKGWPGIGNYKLLSALLFVTMVVLYWIFR